MEEFWMVYRVGGDAPIRRHVCEQIAIQEAERLAGIHQGADFIVLKATHRVRYKTVIVEELSSATPF